MPSMTNKAGFVVDPPKMAASTTFTRVFVVGRGERHHFFFICTRKVFVNGIGNGQDCLIEKVLIGRTPTPWS